jgi:hypothetical protein
MELSRMGELASSASTGSDRGYQTEDHGSRYGASAGAMYGFNVPSQATPTIPPLPVYTSVSVFDQPLLVTPRRGSMPVSSSSNRNPSSSDRPNSISNPFPHATSAQFQSERFGDESSRLSSHRQSLPDLSNVRMGTPRITQITISDQVADDAAPVMNSHHYQQQHHASKQENIIRSSNSSHRSSSSSTSSRSSKSKKSKHVQWDDNVDAVGTKKSKHQQFRSFAMPFFSKPDGAPSPKALKSTAPLLSNKPQKRRYMQLVAEDDPDPENFNPEAEQNLPSKANL